MHLAFLLLFDSRASSKAPIDPSNFHAFFVIFNHCARFFPHLPSSMLMIKRLYLKIDFRVFACSLHELLIVIVFANLYVRAFALQEHIPVEEVFQNLQCGEEGLTTKDGEERIAIFGPNKLEEKKVRFN
jgi:hypothetical protein